MSDRNMKFTEGKNGIVYLTTDFFSSKEVNLAFSTRFGGVSKEPYNSLNLGFSVQDNKDNVKNNRIRFVKGVNCDPERVVFGNQVHGDNIEIIESLGSKGMLINDEMGIERTDGLITLTKNVTLLGSFADCVPIFFYEPKLELVGLVHAGWKGTFSEIGKKSVLKILELGGNVEDIKVIIGPSIGVCCYQVGDELYKKAQGLSYKSEIFLKKQSGLYLDLWKTNFLQLQEAGVLIKNIMVSNMCTFCNYDIFFSYRRGGKKTGRMMGLISLK
ncbi:peptidoglycan editing factor PgeF [Natranaerobius trueperi]|uniref:Purine nucleoside phosphorylase n=1 Tax=Natranaerobius trueperi TaxID=759412 RepID=A0A226BYZ2_9FIRM|nr:peptidoglycan editing factor PgeF [Natranaerobius trueperi]OWZ84141.1 multicopper polyphenol oxidase [Natranaerobius trueperi]